MDRANIFPNQLVSSSYEDILVKKILQTHAPDGRHIDPIPLLHMTEYTIRCVTALMVPGTNSETVATENGHGMKIVGKSKEQGCTVHKISQQMLHNSPGDANKHETTMELLELLGNYTWNMKAVLVLAAVAVSYGQFCLILQLCTTNPLAFSIAKIKQLVNLSDNIKALRAYFKALIYLVERMTRLTKCIIEFESHPMQYMTEDQSIRELKAYIHVATYWVIRSAVVCTSQITSMIAANNKHTNFVIATWELWSLADKVKGVHDHFRKLLDACYLQIEYKVQSILSKLFEGTHDDNQKVLGMLLALKDELPLGFDSSTEKSSINSVLENKVILLLISRPDISLEHLLLLMQQLNDHPHLEFQECFEIIWVPIPRTIPCSQAEERTIDQFASTLPLYLICQPGSLSTSMVKYVKEEWFFADDPLIVVLDSKGKVISLNAIDMVAIWGVTAYPYSTSKEIELWQRQRWTMELLMDEINPTISTLMREGKTICLYASNNLEWIKDMSNKMKDIAKSGVTLKLVYVGCNSSKYASSIVETISRENLSDYLHLTKMFFFWSRLESMRRSRERLGYNTGADNIIKEVKSLTEPDTIANGWLIVSEGPSDNIITLDGRRASEVLSEFQVWSDNVGTDGFLVSIHNALNPREKIAPCDNSTLIPYADNQTERTIVCNKCSRPMKKHVIYQCQVTK